MYGNDWSMYHHDEINSNNIEIDYIEQEVIGNELFDKKRTYVYPNPATDKLHIHTGINMDEVKILDITGKTIHLAYPYRRECMLNVSKLPGGIYFVRIDTGAITRFIKR